MVIVKRNQSFCRDKVKILEIRRTRVAIQWIPISSNKREQFKRYEDSHYNYNNIINIQQKDTSSPSGIIRKQPKTSKHKNFVQTCY